MWLSFEKKIIPVSLKIKGNQDWMHSDEYDHELEEQTELRSGDGLVDSLLDFDENNNKLISDKCYFFHCSWKSC